MTANNPIAAQLAHVENLLRSGNTKDALALARALSNANPHDFSCVRAAILTSHAAADLPGTIEYLRRAVALRPQDASLRLNLAKALHESDDTDAALREIAAALPLQPSASTLYLEARQLLADKQRYMESRTWVERGLAACPGDAALTFAKAGEFLRTGEYDKAMPLYDALIRAMPQMAFFYLDRAYAQNYLPDVDPQHVYAAHKACGAFLDMAPDMSAAWASRDRDVNRVLHVGFIGPDFFRHSVAYFVEALFNNLDRTRVKLHVYHTNRNRDGVTDRIEQAVDVFRHVKQEQPGVLAQIIANDKIDVLIDLAGYTQVHGLTAMAARPAPVMATYCGYPNTTCSSRIGWRIVDSITDPAGSESFNTERLLRLDPCFLCYTPEAQAPEVAPLPSQSRGFVTFGSFNAQRKFNKRICGLWRRVLESVPNSRLAIKSINFTEDSSVTFARQQLQDFGLPMDRVVVFPAAKSASDHLAQYGEIDIALDTYPYHGTTTTCEALWMGIPVVTLAGQTHVSRVGASLLTCVGLPSWIARTDDEYVDIAKRYAADSKALATLRSNLRARVQASELCNAPAFAKKFEAAIRQMWSAWASGR